MGTKNWHLASRRGSSAEPADQRSRWRLDRDLSLAFVSREPLHSALCLAIAIAVTWPLATVFGSRICGDSGDPFQTLWGMRWFHDAVTSFRSPFFTDRIYYPQGSTLVFQTFDIPSTVLMLPLWGMLPEVAIYNTAVVLALSVTVYGMSRLVRYVVDDPLIGLVAGGLFVIVPYQFAHLQGHLHLISMGWLPLYVLFLLRFIREGSTARDALLAGMFLGLASLASWYHLLYALVLTPVLLGYALIAYRRRCMSRSFLRGGCIAVLVYAVVAGPLLTAILLASAREEIAGAHDASMFSADLFAFVYPNAAQAWSGEYGAHFMRWSGNSTENAAYIGFAVLALAVVGTLFNGLGRALFVAALCGAVLALGPFLHVDGRVLSPRMPYWYLQRALPAIQLMGVPVRFGYVMYFGLIVAAAIGLKEIATRAESIARPLRVIVILVSVCVAAYEYRPRPLITTAAQVPKPMRAWSLSSGDWAVFDIWDWYRPMWHSAVHRKPMVGGYLTRVPKRLDDWVYQQRILKTIMLSGQDLVIIRVDRTLDFNWTTGSPDASMEAGPFSVEWNGTLLAPADGDYEFVLSANDAAALSLAGVVTVQCSARDDVGCEASANTHLFAGSNRIRLRMANTGGRAGVRLLWRPPGTVRQIVPPESLETSSGTPGLDAMYQQHVDAVSGLGREGGRAALRALDVRYVITRDVDNACIRSELALPLVYRDEEARIYEVPSAD